MITKDFIWNKETYMGFEKYLYSKKDSDKFIDFNKKLISTKYNMIGIKVPTLRSIAKDISKTDIFKFLDIVKDSTYEEIMLEGLVISYIKDYNIFKKYFNRFIGKIDNWSICDVCISSMKIIKKYKNEFLKEIRGYLKSKDEFIVRVGIVSLLDFYIEKSYIDEVFSLIDSIQTNQYYVNMAIAWLVSTSFVKQKKETYAYLKNNHLSEFTYQKSIQKIIESKRVDEKDKKVVRNMKYHISIESR